MNQTVLGIDIGGANLKYATACGAAMARDFPMWLKPEQLAQTLTADLRNRFPELDFTSAVMAVTMTGELADCFLDRGIGVDHIVRHTCQAAEALGIDDVAFYGVDGFFHTAEQACQNPDLIAAANWHALANFVGQEIAPNALLIDIGSTTTDIIPVLEKQVATNARTDYDRLCQSTLVYVGCRRTPVCSLVTCLDYNGTSTSVMNEVFATIDDAMLLLGHTEENGDDCCTADNQPRTRVMAANRLARMIGLDRRSIGIEQAEEFAQQIITVARQRISMAINQLGKHDTWVLSGHGEPLADIPKGQHHLRLADQLGHEVARSAPAYAVARLRAPLQP